MRLAGKIALVTGGASGIGRATSELFVKEGARVVIADIDVQRGGEVVRSIRETGGEAAFVEVDMALPKEAQKMVSTTVEKYGHIDILFNNAGILGKEGPLAELTEENYRNIMSVNLEGVVWGCRYVIPHMQKRRSGAILNMASLGGIVGRANNAIYNASKAGVILITKTLSRELAPYKIRVNCLCPITVDTPLLEGWPPEARAASAQKIPLGRICQPTDIACAALFLVSDEASMITGIALVIDGGFSA